MNVSDVTVETLLDSIGAKTPVPGGGAVASLTMALGVTLGQMVVNYSKGKKSLAEYDELHDAALAELETFREAALVGAAEDARAYRVLNDLWKLDKDDDRRQREFPAAVRAAIAAPQGVMQACVQLLDLLRRLEGTTNSMLKSDLAIAAILADAAARAAAWNVRINLPLLTDAEEVGQLEGETVALLERARGLVDGIEVACGVRG